MTASTIKSSKISGYESVPVSLQPGGTSGNGVVEYKGTIEIPTTSSDEAADIIKLDRIPSKLRISEIIIFNDALESGTPASAIDIGLYRSDTGAVLDADAFATQSTMFRTANLSGTRAGNAASIANMGKEAWEYCSGVSSDPKVPLDVALTVVTPGDTEVAGTVSWVIRGSLDNS